MILLFYYVVMIICNVLQLWLNCATWVCCFNIYDESLHSVLHNVDAMKLLRRRVYLNREPLKAQVKNTHPASAKDILYIFEVH